jgi:hypothetical protein
MFMAKGKLLGMATEVRGPVGKTWEATVLGLMVKTGDLFDTESPMYFDVDDKEVGTDLVKLVEANTGHFVIINCTVGGRAYKANVVLTHRFHGFADTGHLKTAKAA